MTRNMASIINKLLLSGKYHDLLTLMKGFRNGAVYGAKIRFPHALVMTLLFRGGPISEQARTILRATYTHSKNLASFVILYKGLRLMFIKFDGKPAEYHSFISALIGGYLIWGKYNKVNEQINLYLLSRILYGLIKLGVERGYIPKPKGDSFPIFGALVWGIVLWLFEHHQHTLQPSLQSSMTYLYHESNLWHNIWDFLIYNR
ncbi:hypothetical protein LSH36_560g00004 [Paralvinella palmiformis]|uniref:Peroxisomal membrane protein 4 n=1 Tax=Paralvinella palmiformis TaxID=53620 RepID=A0AAD9J6K9_9ANNE|nr:hypothetical protein LSH36_560g00004 [Paralvinella palmiformis]